MQSGVNLAVSNDPTEEKKIFDFVDRWILKLRNYNKRAFTVEEAKDYLVTCFDSFSGDLSGMIKDAFEQEWIDFYPRKGKRGRD